MPDTKFSALDVIEDHGEADGFIVIRDGGNAARVLAGPRRMRSALVTGLGADTSDPATIVFSDGYVSDYYIYAAAVVAEGGDATIAVSSERDFVSGGNGNLSGGRALVLGDQDGYGGEFTIRGGNATWNSGTEGADGGFVRTIGGWSVAQIPGQLGGGDVVIAGGDRNSATGRAGDTVIRPGRGFGGADRGTIRLQAPPGEGGDMLVINVEGIGFFGAPVAPIPQGDSGTITAGQVWQALASLGLVSDTA